MKTTRPEKIEYLDFERDLPTTEEDVLALRAARERCRLTPREFSRLLADFGHASYEELAARKGPRGEPFEL